jgi:NADH-quinone oxidoreductase subunit E
MPNSTLPSTRMKEINAIEDIARTYEAMLPKQFGGGVNLFIHPMAGAAAMSALGFGMASHAFGLWMGTVAGAVETSRRMLEISSEPLPASALTKGSRKPDLKLVSSTDMPEAAAAAMRTATAEAARLGGEMSKTARAVADDAMAEAGKAEKVAEALVGAPSKRNRERAPIKPKGIARPEIVDDLKTVSGIGPKLEQTLNGLGIWTYEQIAGLSEAEIAWLDSEFGFAGRIVRDDWTGQAGRLAAAK